MRPDNALRCIEIACILVFILFSNDLDQIEIFLELLPVFSKIMFFFFSLTSFTDNFGVNLRLNTTAINVWFLKRFKTIILNHKQLDRVFLLFLTTLGKKVLPIFLNYLYSFYIFLLSYYKYAPIYLFSNSSIFEKISIFHEKFFRVFL